MGSRTFLTSVTVVNRPSVAQIYASQSLLWDEECSQCYFMETALFLTPLLSLTLSLHGLWSSVLSEPWGGGYRVLIYG